jgi:predicted TIM-barrel fold metal-dependent hydrolase
VTVEAARDRRAGTRPARGAIVDADIHNTWPEPSALDPYLPVRWRRLRAQLGERLHAGAQYPRLNPAAARTDAWPPGGGLPGSSLALMREQLLDRWSVEHGILNPLLEAGELLNLEYGAAFARAINDWQVAEWLEPEPRLRASITVVYEDAALAVAELERRADDRRFVQVLLASRTLEPLGRRRYWPLYAAAEALDLPVGIHFGGAGGFPTTAAGLPSFYFEEHAGMATAFQDQLTSLVFEGVLERFPRLRVVLIEGGFAWLLPLMWRLDRTWRMLGDELAHVTRPPSELIRERVYLTTQPIEEPPEPQLLARLLDRMDMDERLLFATDYPHWDFDAPDRALPPVLGGARRARLLQGNARALYRFG